MLIGTEITITDATNKHLIGLKGIVMDDTHYTLVLHTSAGTKRVVKRCCTFSYNNKHIRGRLLEKPPFERIKK